MLERMDSERKGIDFVRIVLGGFIYIALPILLVVGLLSLLKTA